MLTERHRVSHLCSHEFAPCTHVTWLNTTIELISKTHTHTHVLTNIFSWDPRQSSDGFIMFSACVFFLFCGFPPPHLFRQALQRWIEKSSLLFLWRRWWWWPLKPLDDPLSPHRQNKLWKKSRKEEVLFIGWQIVFSELPHVQHVEDLDVFVVVVVVVAAVVAVLLLLAPPKQKVNVLSVVSVEARSCDGWSSQRTLFLALLQAPSRLCLESEWKPFIE